MKNKTYKREVALALLAFIVILCVVDLLTFGTTAAFKWAELLWVPIFVFAMAAFGLDAAAKQFPRRKDAPPDGWAE